MKEKHRDWPAMKIMALRRHNFNYHHHHNHVVLPAQISLTPLSPLLPMAYRHWQVFRATSRILPELLYVCSSWSSCFCSAIMWGSIGIHLLWAYHSFFQQWPACLVRLTWIVFVMGGRWPYSWCFAWFSRQDLFNIAAAFLCNCRLIQNISLDNKLKEIHRKESNNLTFH